MSSYIDSILSEIGPLAENVSEAELGALADEILGANQIFLAGAGRSGLMIRAFANRLMHLGLKASVVGDVTCPHTKPGDLLIVGSGSGETSSLVDIARRASKSGVRVALVTASPSSTLARMANAVLTIPAQAKGASEKSIQPMASSFEQVCMLVYDALVLLLMKRTGETGETMYARHADLE